MSWKKIAVTLAALAFAFGVIANKKVQWYEVKGLSEENSSKNVG